MPERPSEARTASHDEPAKLELQAGLESNVGPVRELNEDYTDLVLPKAEERKAGKGALFVVADGMGGHQAGEVASRWAVERVIHEYYGDTARDPGSSLVHAVKVANQMIYEHAQADPSKAGMGTTLVAAAVLGRQVYVANVGDSRAYLINGHGICQITEDHSWVEEQVRAGRMTREQAEQHPQRNLITRALGHKSMVQVDLFLGEIHAGDMLLLCSDGLSGRVSGEQMAAIVLAQAPSHAATMLVTQAIAQNTDDNVSALVVKAVDPRHAIAAEALAREQLLREEDEAPTVVRDSGAFGPPMGSADTWLQNLGTGFRLAVKRQKWLLVAFGVLIIVICLCVSVAGISAAGQVMAGAPSVAPEQAVIRYDQAATDDPNWWAGYLGYDNVDDWLAAVDLWPARRDVLVAGAAREWACKGEECSFYLDMAEKEYVIRIGHRISEEEDLDLAGRFVRVYGSQDEEGQPVVAQLIDQRRAWWSLWQPAWSTVYDNRSGSGTVWLYCVADHESFSPIRMSDYPELIRGDRLLLRGHWVEEQRSDVVSFAEDTVYRLETGRYAPLFGVPDPAMRPTVTPNAP
jgi:serine/threonine protein phosphatase PrpC